MNLLNKFFAWKDENEHKRMQKMRERDTCPDCRGRGFNPIMLNEFTYIGAYDDYKCPGCDGSGRYSDWEQMETE